MAKKFVFTKKLIEELPIPQGGKRIEYRDEVVKGLTLRLSSSGSRIFYVRRQTNDVSDRIHLGRYPFVSIEQARAKAYDVLSSIAQGINPQDERRTEKIEKIEITVDDILNNYLSGHAKVNCVSHDEMERDFERYLGDWRHRPLKDVSRADIQNRINQIRKLHGASAANHTIILMKAATNWNIRSGFIEPNNPWSSVKTFKIQARERFMHPEELSRFFLNLQKMDNPVVRDFILISLYTGARKSNVLAMNWNDVDIKLGLWRIPVTKNGDSHVVPLTTAALEVLKQRGEFRENDWVFPGRIRFEHLVEPKRAWYRLLRDAKIENLRMHDLRRTLGSYMAMANHSLPIIGKALGHRSTSATHIYARLANDPVRAAMEQAQTNIRLLAEEAQDIVS